MAIRNVTAANPALLFRALADETRLQMLALIRQHGELCVCDLENVLQITQSKASRHLRYLLNAGLVEDRRETVWIYYRIADRLDANTQVVLDHAVRLLEPRQVRQLSMALREWRRQKQGSTVTRRGTDRKPVLEDE